MPERGSRYSDGKGKKKYSHHINSETNLHVYGVNLQTKDGSCVRDFIHVEDIAAAHLKAAQRLLSSSLTGAEAYNLSNGDGYSVLEVVEACRRITGQPIFYRLENSRLGDPHILIGNSENAKSVLGWTCAISGLDEIVASAWRWVLKNNTSNAKNRV